MKRTISILIENKPGALARAVGLFHQRGYNIESLNVAPLTDGTYSRMTVITKGTENVVEQITKQINKLIDVIKVSDLSEGEHHEIELIIFKFIKSKYNTRIQKILKKKKISVIERSDVVTVAVIDENSDFDSLVKRIGKNNIYEIVRSGGVGIHETEKNLNL